MDDWRLQGKTQPAFTHCRTPSESPERVTRSLRTLLSTAAATQGSETKVSVTLLFSLCSDCVCVSHLFHPQLLM